MRPVPRLIWIALLLAALVLAACDDDVESQRTQLDVPNPTATPIPPTNTPWPTSWPTATRVSRTPRPTATPFPTPDPEEGTDEPLDNYIVPGDWQRAAFVDADGEQRTLQEFADRPIVIHTLSATCDLCLEQHQALLAAIRDRHESNDLTDNVFLALGVVEGESAALLRDVLQESLADQWATVDLLAQDDLAADYMVGSASPELLDALEREFGPEAIQPIALTVIVVEPNGLAHLMPEGMVTMEALRDAISFYQYPPDDLSLEDADDSIE